MNKNPDLAKGQDFFLLFIRNRNNIISIFEKVIINKTQ